MTDPPGEHPEHRAIVSVALPLPLRREFSYLVPAGIPVPSPGARVRVPFGERALTGVVVSAEGESAAGMREIVQALDDEPVCPPDLLHLARRTAVRFFASTGEVLKTALPARLPPAGALRYRITDRGALGRGATGGAEAAILDALASGGEVRAAELPAEGRAEAIRALEERGWIRAVSSFRESRRRVVRFFALPAQAEGGLPKARAGETVPPVPPTSPLSMRTRARRQEVLAWLASRGRPATAAEIKAATGAGPGVLSTLVERGRLSTFEAAARSGPAADALAPRRTVQLTEEQESACSSIRKAILERRYYPALLQGVTGSGKTEVYLRSIAEAMSQGRGAIWLVPEIALTPVFARELKREFRERAALLHSALTEKERGETWNRVRSGDARVVIGPRSAVFAPVRDLGMIVVDEEHDASYKQRESPRYDAREVAALRAGAAGAVLLFGTATPSVEAHRASREGRLARLLLTERIDAKPLPDVTIVDLRREIPRPDEKGIPLFSRPLVERLRETFSNGEQAILLQPRRGYAPFLLCRQCGHDFRCSQCSVSRTVHDRGSRLVCHYCGEREPRPLRCPECAGGILEAIGFGTERVADRFAEIFPGVPYAILDRDTTRRRGKGGPGAVVDDVLAGRVSCLIGTQMVAKGHDFPNVTAVGVLSADTLLNFPDFRAAEKTFQLIAQVAGRAGRGDAPGTVHVQTFHPGHPAIRRAATHDVDGFYEEELAFRRSFFYPPFCELAAILVSSSDRDRAAKTAADIGAAAAAAAMPKGAAGTLRLSGPAPAPLERLQGRWRFQLLLRTANRRSLLEALEACVPERPPSGVQIAADVDPQDLL